MQEEAVSDGHCEVSFYLPIVTENDNTDVVSLQVESHTLGARLELNHLTGLDLGETEDSGDTVTNGDDRTELLEVVLLTNKINSVSISAAVIALIGSSSRRVSALPI